MPFITRGILWLMPRAYMTYDDRMHERADTIWHFAKVRALF